MEDYIYSVYFNSSQSITEDDINRYSALLEHDRGIESFRVSPEGIYLEYNAYLYNQKQLEHELHKNGFIKKQDKRSGFFMRQVNSLAESNKKTYGNRRLDCCDN